MDWKVIALGIAGVITVELIVADFINIMNRVKVYGWHQCIGEVIVMLAINLAFGLFYIGMVVAIL